MPEQMPPVLTNMFCSGCGVCVAACPTQAITITRDRCGSLRPTLSRQDTCNGCGFCMRVCPFLEMHPNETEIGDELFGSQNMEFADEVGHFSTCWVGAVCDVKSRLSSSSGGLATWLLAELLRRGIADAVACVVDGFNRALNPFEYRLFESESDIVRGVGSKYCQVDISHVVRHMIGTPGRYAVVGLPCTLKALRRLCFMHQKLRERLTFMVGLTCSRVKTAYFTEYLVGQCGVTMEETAAIQFRVKKPPTSSFFYFKVVSLDGNEMYIPSSHHDYYRVMGSGCFSVSACRICDDIFAEVADVTFMDAWLPEFDSEWRGTSLVVSRSATANGLFSAGASQCRIQLSKISADRVIVSQQSTVNSKRSLIRHYLWLYKIMGKQPPRKRVSSEAPRIQVLIPMLFDIAFQIASEHAWEVQRASGRVGCSLYDRRMFLLWESYRAYLRLRDKVRTVRALRGDKAAR